MIHGRFHRDETGTTAVEFALVGPAFVLLIMGTMMLGLMLFSAISLEYAAQKAARCAAILGEPCANPQDRYQGMTKTPVFTTQVRTCGLAITARTTFDLDLVVWHEVVALTATACG